METKGKRSIVCLVLLLGILSMTALAGNDQRIGTAGAPELLIPVGARGIAIGGSSMVFMTGTEAIYWNPAGLGHLDRSVEALISHMQYFGDINVTYGALGIASGEFGNLGISLKSLSFGNIPVTTELYPDGTGENYSPTFMTIGVSYAKMLTDRISVGVTGNIVSEKIMSTSSSGIGFNIGVQYQNLGITGLNLGVAVKNVGPNMTYDGPDLLRTATAQDALRGSQFYKVQAASAEMPSSMEIGIGYTRKFDDQNSALIGGMFRNNNSQDDEYSLGAEYSYSNLFFLRGGYNFAPQAQKDLVGTNSYLYDYQIGAGVHYDVGGVDLAFDYCYRHQRLMDANNIITLRIGF